tara:strand:- start:535 stop:711 length:177 start_codon:yes stop_codon:yes gene_type:complete
MEKFKYNAKFKTDFSKGSCDGDCQAKNIDEAEKVIRSGIAKDLSISESEITEINIATK